MIVQSLQNYDKIVIIDGKKTNLCIGCLETNCASKTHIDYCKYGDADV